MNIINKSFLLVFIFLSSFVYSHELPDNLEKNQFYTISKEWLYFDSAWGEHEWLYQAHRAFDLDSTTEELFIYLHQSEGWKVGDLLYVDPKSSKVYNLRTKRWARPFEIFHLPSPS